MAGGHKWLRKHTSGLHKYRKTIWKGTWWSKSTRFWIPPFIVTNQCNAWWYWTRYFRSKKCTFNQIAQDLWCDERVSIPNRNQRFREKTSQKGLLLFWNICIENPIRLDVKNFTHLRNLILTNMTNSCKLVFGPSFSFSKNLVASLKSVLFFLKITNDV